MHYENKSIIYMSIILIKLLEFRRSLAGEWNTLVKSYASWERFLKGGVRL